MISTILVPDTMSDNVWHIYFANHYAGKIESTDIVSGDDYFHLYQVTTAAGNNPFPTFDNFSEAINSLEVLAWKLFLADRELNLHNQWAKADMFTLEVNA